jgi:hypothetical protein
MSKMNDECRAARMKGLKTFVPSRPCKYGHKMRYVPSMNCVVCARTAKKIAIVGMPYGWVYHKIAIHIDDAAMILETVDVMNYARGLITKAGRWTP